MSLAFLTGEDEQLNEHEIAWKTRDFDKVKELAKEFKEPKEQALFDILNNVTLKTGHRSVDSFSDYSQFALNNALSQHIPMMGFAYELNQMNGHISDQQHYDYMYYGIRKTSLPRVKFANVHDDWTERLFEKLVAKYYQVNATRAREYISGFSGEQLEVMRSVLRPMVTGDHDEVMKFIPTKVERTRVFNEVKKW